MLLQGNHAEARGTSAGPDKPDAVASLERWFERHVFSFRHHESPASALSVAGSTRRPRARSLPQQPGIWGNRAVQKLIATQAKQAKTNARPDRGNARGAHPAFGRLVRNYMTQLRGKEWNPSHRLQWPDGVSLEWPAVQTRKANAGAKEEGQMEDKLEHDAQGVGDDDASPAHASDATRRGRGDGLERESRNAGKRWSQRVGGFDLQPEQGESFFAMRRGPPFAPSDVRYGMPARMPALETSSADDWMRIGGTAMLGSAGAAREPSASRPQGRPVASGQRNQAGLKAQLRSQTLRAVTHAAGHVHRRPTALPSSFYKAGRSARSGGSDDWLGLSTDMDPSDLLAGPKRSSRLAPAVSPASRQGKGAHVKPFSAGFRKVRSKRTNQDTRA